jgi:hypothetical protein
MSDTSPGVRFEKVAFTGGQWYASPPCRAVIVGTGGVINGKTGAMAAVTVTAELPAGWHPICFSQITESGTDAADLTAVW